MLVSDTDGSWLFLYASLGAAALFALALRPRVERVLDGAGRSERDLALLSSILGRLEREQFRSGKLRQVRASFGSGPEGASRRIRRFLRLMDACEWRRLDIPFVIVLIVAFQPNVIVLPFLFALWATQMAFAIESWRTRTGPSISGWLAAVGEFEALGSLAGYAYEHPADPFPQIAESGPVFDGHELGHPLMPSSICVPNTVQLGGAPQLLVVSGSNMSGKSTLLRTVGVNAVMALTGAPVRARRLRLSPLSIGSTIRIQDSLRAGTSRFYAEIQRIRQITELADGGRHVLFLLDELLHGTNSHDRSQGAEAILDGLIRRGAVGLATTHDLALARIADRLEPRAANVHFEDQLVDGKMVFDYRMKPGVVEHSNAIELMRAVGLEV